jgi:DNA-binding response OmpR family regulator
LRRSVWLADGRRVDLSTSPTSLRILETLADAGGSATKDQLARAVWDVGTYHPLRDDKRIQVAMRRLRMAIEEDPASPVRVLTTRDGYAFGTAIPVRRLSRNRV